MLANTKHTTSRNGGLNFLVALSRYRRRRIVHITVDEVEHPSSSDGHLLSVGLQILCSIAVFLGGLILCQPSWLHILVVGLEIEFFVGIIFVSLIRSSAFRFFKLGLSRKPDKLLTPPFHGGHDPNFRGPKIHVNVIGPAKGVTRIVVCNTDTIADVVKRSISTELQRIEPIVYFPPHRSGPLDYYCILSSIGISDGSTLYLRWRLRGGSSERDPHSGPDNPHDNSSAPSTALQFTSRTGRFNAKNAQYFRRLQTGMYECTICPFPTPLQPKRIRPHEQTHTHMQAVRRKEKNIGLALPEPGEPVAGPSTAAHLSAESVRGPLSELLDSIRTNPHNPLDNEWVDIESGMASGIDWEAASMDTQMQPSLDAHTMKEMAEKTRQYLLRPEGLNDNSDSEVDERSGSESDGSDASESQFAAGDHEPQSHFPSRSKRKVTDNPLSPYFPWPDRETCILDILRHVPRCAFSRKQNETIHWAMLALGVSDLPSDRVMDDIDRALQDLCGIESLRYKGALGHVYYSNDMAGIIAQEMANPNVRKHLHFYPEDAGDHLSEAWQATRWRDELDSRLTTPMVRVHGQDFYTDEISLLRNGACMPRRWIMRGQDMFARAWMAHPAGAGWIVNTSQEYEIPAADLLLAFTGLNNTHHQQQLPNPKNIISEQKSTEIVTPWTGPVENPWRIRSNGHRVLAFPMWLYCDDTSGNQSKKWNKHNSFLFTAAGLPRRLVHQESNIHFLSTSNLAPPLEMLDAIVQQLENGQTKGIWAWDCEAKEKVLIIPSILAMLGDNPMQSEFACHIGLRGRKFCRMCHVEGDVEGAEAEDGPSEGTSTAPLASTEQDSDASSAPSDTSSIADQRPAKKMKRSTKKTETMIEMIQRVRNFVTIGLPRKKIETQQALRSQFIEACRVGGNAEFKRLKTQHGIKDTFQGFFLDRLAAISTKRGRSKEEKEKAMREIRRSFPPNITSPVWRIKDFDPHSDTPVEILHVILLGFVKYFWRDAIHRLKADQKDILISRLSSFDTSGLNVPALSGSTLVTYAGSLTGRDFRIVAQVAPFVLYDLLEKDLLECWKAIGILVPLVWQPRIDNVNAHLKSITAAIDLFLDCSCRVTPRWFNKPKFHIILHLPEHIRRFGPAMLFATEGFESFNAIIRSASVHSNRHAPSRDIAHRMAKGNRVRHLVSGGVFLMNRLANKSAKSRRTPNTTPESISTWMERIENPDSLVWHTTGPEPRKLLNIHGFGERILGLAKNNDREPTIGLCSRRGFQMKWSSTSAAKNGFSLRIQADSLVYTPRDTVLANGDLAHPGSWVIYVSVQGVPRVGQIVHAIQVVGSKEEQTGKCSFLVVAPAISTERHDHYGMPRLQLHAVQEWECISASTIRCTVNVQHNCVERLCKLTKSRVIYQEREATDSFTMGVSHITPDDVLLNTAQMRDAIHILPFHLPIPSLHREQIIAQAAKLEVDERNTKKTKQAALDAAKASSVPKTTSRPSSMAGPSQLRKVLSRTTKQARGGTVTLPASGTPSMMPPPPAAHAPASSFGHFHVPGYPSQSPQ
ncbi:hypothetical protein Hypma_003108 [Hypsizygus marmoreus]|uniref:Uncharacterized protein n=1 Tax=Hypsizygus marmoreus TaxID=39966 RepID=A0A369J468_HYPMA|nr:hypothetical protein Hypma_003108 [Hypsizygus marmoreus]